MNRFAVTAVGAVLAGVLASPVGAQPGPALNYVQPLTPSGIQAVQQRLQQQGAYTGPVDGVWGPDSETALSNYQQQHGLQVTGQMNQATAAVLGLNSAQLVGAAPVASAAAPITLSPRAVREMQARLRQLGYYNGAIDGVWGPGAEDALRRFQAASGIEVTGRINAQTVTAMGLNPQTITAQ